MLIIVFPTFAVVDTHTPPKRPPNNMNLSGIRSGKPYMLPPPPPKDRIIREGQTPMLPTIDVSVPMPFIKNDPRLKGIPTIDSEDAVMVRQYLNEQETQEIATNEAQHKAAMRRVVAKCVALVAFTTPLKLFVSPHFVVLMFGLLPLLDEIEKELKQTIERRMAIRRRKQEQLADLVLCPPLPTTPSPFS